MAAQICETPIALVSLVDECRQWFKSKVGLDAKETLRDISFCTYTILQPDVLIVPDTQADSRFATNPLVTCEPHIRFYAGAPLLTPAGYRLGTLCVIDRVPRTLSQQQVEALRVLSSQVSAQLELRLNLINLLDANSALGQSEQKLRLLFETSMNIMQKAHAELERRVEEKTTELAKLAALTTEISQAVTKSDSLQVILQQCTEILVQHLNVAFARIWLLNEAENVLELKASAGLYTHLDGSHSRVAVGQLKIGRIATNRQPHLTNKVVDDPQVRDREWALREGMIALAGYPLLVEDAVVGVMAMFARQPLTELTLNRLRAITTPIAQCIKRKRTEAALKESQRRLTTLINSLPGIAFSAGNDSNWSLTYLSEGCYALTGYKREELIVNGIVPYNSIIHFEDLPRVIKTIDAALNTRQPYVVEYRIRTRSGQEKWLWEKGSGVFDSNGAVLELEGFITDISELKQTESALRQAKEKYRALFENAVGGIYQTDPQGFYISANPTLAKIYGYKSPEELIGNLTDIGQQLYVDSNQRTKFIYQVQKHDALSNFESQIYRQDGSVIWISENARAVRDVNGTLLYYEGSVPLTSLSAR